jgi:indolepyruvate ferredoxin oxidoreductase
MMAIKDEYEVARLYSDGQFSQQIKQMFEGDIKLSVHLAPPLLAKQDPASGRPRKSQYGSWIWPAFKLLRHLRAVRGTWMDVFGYTEERKRERQARDDYCAILVEICANLTPKNYESAVEMASLPDKIRGFGPVRLSHMIAAETELQALKKRFYAE